MRPFQSLACVVSALAVVAAAAPAIAQDAAPQRVRVTNKGVNPVTFDLDGVSKDIRPRKTMTFTAKTEAPTYSLFFHNGVMARGEIDLNEAAPVAGPEGAQFHCVIITEEGMEVETQEACTARVNK